MARRDKDHDPAIPAARPKPGDDADTYALKREEADIRHGAGWWVSLRRRGRNIRRLFKDSIHGSSQASFAEAKAYRDAVISALPPPTNHEQAVLLRKNNTSGISGVRRIETREGDAWQATLMTNEGQKRENFSVAKFGEEAAMSMAITQRRKWLKDLPVKHLAYAHHAEEMTRINFGQDLAPAADVLPQAALSEEEIDRRLQAINERFDKDRPKRLRVRVKSYHKDRLSIAVSDAGHPAQRRLVQLNTTSLSGEATVAAAKAKIIEIIAEFYSSDIANWFMQTHGDEALAVERFDPSEGLNLLVFVPA